MVWWGYRAAGKAVAGGARAGGRGGAVAGETLATKWALHQAAKGARRGYLAPGDPTPPPTATTDYLDYRGVAAWADAQNLDGGQFPVGAFADLSRRAFRGPIGLPGEVMNRHAVVVGPAGSGKTYSLLIPWMYAALTSNWSVVAVDVKGDLREDFLDFKDEIGGGALGARLTKWDFTDPRGSSPWDWLAELHDDARMDAAITALLGRRPEQSTSDPYFYQRDYRTLRGLLTFARAVVPDVRTASDLIRLLEDDIKLDALIKQTPRAGGASDLEAALRYPQADYPKVISGVVTALSALDSAAVNAVTRAAATRPSINLEHALDDHQLLIVGAALKGGEVSATLSSLLLNQLAQRLYERFGEARRPVLLVIDEAPRIVDRVDVAKLMEVSRSAGVGVVVAMQDVAQIHDENDRSSILSNASAFAILPGASPKSVDEFGKRLGSRFERTVGMSTGPRMRGLGGLETSQNVGVEPVPVLREREIMQPPVGGRPAVIHVKAPELGVTAKPLLVEMQRGD
jgi:type IV secretory pathway TraG/TraD family ATPase VirD4